MTDDVFVRMIDFPTCACGGVLLKNEDDTFTVLLNARLSNEQNRKSYLHELKHIEHDDFYRDVTIEQIEREAGA